MTVTNITIQTTEGRVVGVLDSLTYTIIRELAPIYTMGTPKKPYTKRKLAIAGHLFLSKPLDSEWLTSRSGLETFNLVEPLDVIFQIDDGTRATLVGCNLLNEGYGVSYRDLIGFTGGFTFVASGMYYGESKQDVVNYNTLLGYEALKSDTNESSGMKITSTADKAVCANSFWDQVYAQEYDAKFIEEASLKEEEDPHKGMIYNPYTDKWSFL